MKRLIVLLMLLVTLSGCSYGRAVYTALTGSNEVIRIVGSLLHQLDSPETQALTVECKERGEATCTGLGLRVQQFGGYPEVDILLSFNDHRQIARMAKIQSGQDITCTGHWDGRVLHARTCTGK